MASKDEILMNFQACTGLEDIAVSIQILEQHNWDLPVAVNSVLPQDFSALGLAASDGVEGGGEEITFDAEVASSNVCVPVQETEAQSGDKEEVVVDLTYNQEVVDLTGEERLSLEERPTRKREPTAEKNGLCPPSSSLTCQLVVHQNHISSTDKIFTFSYSTTLAQVKERISESVGIAAHEQILLGLPPGSRDHMTLREVGIPQIGFMVTVVMGAKEQQPQYRRQQVAMLGDQRGPIVSSTTDGVGEDVECYHDTADTTSSSGEDDDEEGDAAGDVIEEMFISDECDSPSTRAMKEPLIARDCVEPSKGLACFSQRFAQRYGNLHPLFYIGSLSDAVNEATGGPVAKRKPLFIYLHHDKSVLSNIFCSQLLCCESIVTYLSNNFLVWAWDLTHEELKRKLLDMVKESFGMPVATNIDDIKPDHLPAILIVSKAGSNVEVNNIIQGHTAPDQLMSDLIFAQEQHSAQMQYDLKEERERLAREQMKYEQEKAFEESLMADQQKEKLKQFEDDQRKMKERQDKEEQQRKEDERREMESNVPPEPDASGEHKVATLRFRLPTGELKQRRFLAVHTVKMVLNYVGSLGYHPTNHKVLFSFPRRDITQSNSDLSLEEAKLFPQEILYVEER